jgi:hypothetical protein
MSKNTKDYHEPKVIAQFGRIRISEFSSFSYWLENIDDSGCMCEGMEVSKSCFNKMIEEWFDKEM